MARRRRHSSWDPRDMPRYHLPEVASYVRMQVPTLETWVRGRDSQAPIIIRPSTADPRLSYHNLIETYIVDVLRRRMHIPLQDIREGIETAARRHDIERVLLSDRLRAREGNLLLELVGGGYENIGRGGQREIPEAVEAYLHRIEYEDGLPVELYPVIQTDNPTGPQRIVILPDVGFGKPVTKRNHISAAVIADRFRAGESPGSLAEDYDLEALDVEEAIRAEQIKAAA